MPNKIAYFEGDGSKQATGPFTIGDAIAVWSISWNTREETPFSLSLINHDNGGLVQGSIANGSTTGNKQLLEKGNFHFRVTAAAHWTISVFDGSL